MKKFIAVTIILTILSGLLAYSCYLAGMKEGKQYAIRNADLWILSWDEPEDGDVTISIDLDGQWYEHAAFIG